MQGFFCEQKSPNKVFITIFGLNSYTMSKDSNNSINILLERIVLIAEIIGFKGLIPAVISIVSAILNNAFNWLEIDKMDYIILGIIAIVWTYTIISDKYHHYLSNKRMSEFEKELQLQITDIQEQLAEIRFVLFSRIGFEEKRTGNIVKNDYGYMYGKTDNIYEILNRLIEKVSPQMELEKLMDKQTMKSEKDQFLEQERIRNSPYEIKKHQLYCEMQQLMQIQSPPN